MKKAIATRWIKALNSGTYKQGKTRLRTDARFSGFATDDRYCCLGVLCDLYDRDRKKQKRKSVLIKQSDGSHTYGGCNSYLPKAVQTWSGIRSSNGYLSYIGNRYTSLDVLNDGDFLSSGKTFKQIAKIIESNIDLL